MTMTGLPRAREVLSSIDDFNGRPNAALFEAMSAHVTAIATVELAAATQLAALIALSNGPGFQEDYTPAQRAFIIRQISTLVGVADIER